MNIKELRRLKMLRQRLTADGTRSKLIARVTRRIKVTEKAITEQVFSGLGPSSLSKADIFCPVTKNEDLHDPKK